MDKEIIVTNVQYENPEHEAALNEIKGQLLQEVELKGKQDGCQNKPTTPGEHQALALNLIEVKIQGAIDLNQQRFLPISGVAAAKLAEIEANKKEQELQNAINEEEYALPNAKKDADRLKPDIKLINIRKLVFAAMVFIALTEGFLSYPAFRRVSFPVFAAFIASVAIAFAVGIAGHHLGGYIKNARNKAQTIGRYIVSLLPAIIGFGVLAVLRASAYNHDTNLQIGTQHVAPQHHGGASAVAIAIVSILLFWVGLFLSSRYFRTKEERLQEQAYEEKCQTLAALEKSIQDKRDEIVRVRYDKITRMTLAVKMYEYALHQEHRLVGFAQEAAEAYKQKNQRNRTDGIPSFFSEKPVFHFNLFFNNVKPQKYDAA
jgi:hypothetical protein